MKKIREKRIRETIKNAVAVLVLAIVTVILLEIPRQYYSWQDENIVNRVNIRDYSVVTVNETMNLYQKISALADDESIVAEGKKTQFSESERTQMLEALSTEIDSMLSYDYAWRSSINWRLISKDIYKEWRSLQIIRVVDSKIYSFDLIIVAFYDKEMNDYGVILFDMDSGKILDINAHLYYGMNEIYDSTDLATYDIAGNYEIEEYENQMLFIASLERYYGLDIPYDISRAIVTSNSISACPFTTEEAIYGKTMSTIYDYIYKTFPLLYF